MNLIEKAVAPLKEDAIERARQEALKEIEQVKEALAEHGGDINAAAPYPRSMSGFGSIQYYVARLRHNRFHSVTVSDPAHGTYQRNNGIGPYYVVIDEERAARYVEQRKKDAALDYDAFVRKLVAKIGPVKKARLIGNHVWSYSTLVVEKAGKITEAWKTQQIVNTSKHGKLFNQWPTRKMKAVPPIEEAA